MSWGTVSKALYNDLIDSEDISEEEEVMKVDVQVHAHHAAIKGSAILLGLVVLMCAMLAV